MKSVATVEAIARLGLKGDRYSEDRGHWKSIDGCQVTLITEDDLEQTGKANPALSHDLHQGSHRRNLVVGGINTKQLEGKEFRIGTAVFRYDKPRPPCAYLDQLTGQNMSHALGLRSGVCLKVVRSGQLSVGDTLELLETASDKVLGES